MKIREITEADIPALIAVCNACEHVVTERPSIYWMFSKFFPKTSFVAEKNGSVLGILLGFISQTEPVQGIVHILGVLPSARGQGVGRALLDTFEDVIREQGVESISLTTLVENENARSFYQKVGFNEPKLIYKIGSERFEFIRLVR